MLIFFPIITMGGSQNRMKPKSCDTVKDNKRVWDFLEVKGVTPYMEKLNVFDMKTSPDNRVLEIGEKE